jgi:hypothetical protein
MSSDSYSIDLLNIRLPGSMQARADRIARSTAEALSGLEPGLSVNVRSLDIPAVRVSHGESDTIIARRIASSIHSSLSRTQGNGGDQNNGGTSS